MSLSIRKGLGVENAGLSSPLDEAYFGSRSKSTLRALSMGKQIDSRKLAFKLVKEYPVREDAWDFLRANIVTSTGINAKSMRVYMLP